MRLHTENLQISALNADAIIQSLLVSPSAQREQFVIAVAVKKGGNQ